MSIIKTPIRTVYDGAGAAIGLAEYQVGEAIGIEHGGTGGNTVNEVKLNFSLTDSNIRSLIRVTGGGTYDNTTGTINVIATDLTPFAKTVDLTTANVTENTNLYYTVQRANTAIDNRVTKAFVDALGVDATTLDGIDSLPFAKDSDLTTANVSELTNLYFTNDRVYSNVVSIGYATNSNVALKANVVDLTTANVTELTNLYFTVARANTAIDNRVDKAFIDALNVDADTLDGNDSTYFAPVNSPSLTGTPLAPTASAGTNTTQIATTAFVTTAVANIVDAAPEALNTLNELAAALGDDANYATTTATLIGNANTNALAAFSQANVATVNASAAFDSANTKVATVAGITATTITNTQLLAGIVNADATSLLPVVFNQAGINTSTAVYTFDKTIYRAAELLFTITNGTSYKLVKTLVIHDGTNITFGDNYLDDNEVTIGTINTSYSFTISGNDVRLVITPTSGTCAVKGKVNLVAI